MEGRGGVGERGVSAKVSKGRAWSSDQEGAQRTGRSGGSGDGQGGTWDMGLRGNLNDTNLGEGPR